MPKSKNKNRQKQRSRLQDTLEAQTRPVSASTKVSAEKPGHDESTIDKQLTAHTHGLSNIHFIKVEVNKVRVVISYNLSLYHTKEFLIGPIGIIVSIVACIISLLFIAPSLTRDIALGICIFCAGICGHWLFTEIKKLKKSKFNNDDEFIDSIIMGMTENTDQWNDSGKFIGSSKIIHAQNNEPHCSEIAQTIHNNFI